MKISKSIHTIDSHTMGEPTRVVIGGVPVIPGKTMAEKKAYLEDNLDTLRTSIMHEPRGHNDMFGSIITQPTMEDADIGIIFMDGGGYLNMCGHGSIGAVTVAVETGMVPVIEPFTEINLESPVGLIRSRVKVQDGKAKEVSIVNVPSFLYKENQEVFVPSLGKKIIFDISFGGSFFILVKSEELGLDICAQNTTKLSSIGMEILEIVNREIKIQHPTLEHIKTADLVEVYGPAKSPEANLQNVVIFGDGQVDRSPCGTGTSAKVATLYARGKLDLNEEFVYESITGTMFKARALEEVQCAGYMAVIPEITGSAYITGFNYFLIDMEDPLRHGFTLR
ncbi:MAG: proline racemase [Anaeromicrobium sp.]|jgi:proline racemase/trans-L-3-hydroxyproline dehydratase|uniref:proline racemase n=1 Tax=Anaeromicrobium sp. TaxID=1929132 RepID=UPI0025FB4279|nr:proline racemase [Anaeromicrobium sp.]MCT4594728.1 proline racemase [Anaeromicrobium sp.]